jgi:hypothetical protein
LRAFENKIQVRIFVPERKETNRIWRKLCNEKLHNLYSSPNIIRALKLRMRWVGYVAGMGEMRYIQNFSQRPQGRGHLGDLHVDGRIILRYILKKYI